MGAAEIKSRMKSVEETKKVTDAMYMISSVKMKRAKREVANTEPYFTALTQKLGELLNYIPNTQNRYFHTALEGRAHARHGILLITSDKGLAGTYNQTAIQVAETYMARHPETVLLIIGEYGRQYFDSRKIPYVHDFYCPAGTPSLYKAQKITADLIARFDAGELDEINVIFTDYNSGKANECRRSCLLPLDKSSFRQAQKEPNTNSFKAFLPTPEAVLSQMIPGYLTGCVYSYLVDSFCSEQEARMTAMKTAADNAEEVLASLRTAYNSLRQWAITKEMTEISSGAKALAKKRKGKL